MENPIQRRRRFPKTRKFRLKDNVAYTEDNVVIYNIVVTSIPRQTTQKEISDHFRGFGPFKKIMFYSKIKICKPYNTPTRVIIKYHYSQSATKALIMDHTIGLKRLTVEPCDSWRQPSNVQIERQLSVANESTIQINTIFMLLSNLNDDCLYHIYNYMPRSKQAFLAKTSEQAKQVFREFCRIKYKTLDMNELNQMTVWERFEFIEAVGENVTKVCGFRSGKVCSRTLEFIAQYCPNIISVEMYGTIFKTSDLCTFLSKLKNLEKLRLHACMVCNGALAKIFTLKNLHSLDLSGNRGLCGIYLQSAISLNYLNLANCGYMSEIVHISLMKNLKKLKYLNLSKCHFTSQIGYDIILYKCCQIEVLGIDLDPKFKYEILARLPRLEKFQATSSHSKRLRKELFEEFIIYKTTELKGLWIDSEYLLTDQIVEYIGQLVALEFLSLRKNLNDKKLSYLHNLKNLRYLDLSETASLNNIDLFQLIKNLPKLLELDIQFCERISTSFVISLIHFFEYEHHEREEVLIIYVASNRSEILELKEIYKRMNIQLRKEYVKLEFNNHCRGNNFLELESPFEIFRSGK